MTLRVILPTMPPGAADPRPRTIAILVLLQTVLLALIARMTFTANAPLHEPDIEHYYKSVQQVVNGAIPYLDFPLEYPPLALLAFAAPVLGGATIDFQEYVLRLLITNAILSAVVCVCALRIGRHTLGPGHSRRVLAGYSALVLVGGPLFLWRFDLAPSIVTGVAVLAVLSGWPVLAGILLATGVAMKLYPVVLGPILLAWYAARGDHSSLKRFVGAGVVTLLAVMVPAAVASEGAVLGFLEYHVQRGLEIETVAGGVVMLGSVLGMTTVHSEFTFGAIHLRFPGAGPLLSALSIVLVALLLGIPVAAFRRFRREHAMTGDVASGTLIGYVASILLAFMLAGKVFSPQFLIWLLPFVPVLPRRQVLLAFVVFVLTIVIYPYEYFALVRFEPRAVVELNLRNAAALALLTWLLVSLSPAAAKARPATSAA